MARLAHDGFGMLELNRAEYGNIESQCVAAVDLENGMFVDVDKAAGKVGAGTGKNKGLVMNSERIYDQFKPGLKNYVTKAGEMASVLFVRPGYTFTTNTVELGTYADYAAVVTALASGKIYGKSASNVIALTSTASGAEFEVVKATTMPDGQEAFKFIVL